MEKCDVDKLIQVKSVRIIFKECSSTSDICLQYEQVLVDGPCFHEQFH